ncbi:MAG: hypothetical protein ACP6IS_07905 [Candidatus Asgardarchaeia archaeon]
MQWGIYKRKHKLIIASLCTLIIVAGFLYLPIDYSMSIIRLQSVYTDNIPIPEATPISTHNRNMLKNFSIYFQTVDNKQHWWAGVVSRYSHPTAVYISFQHETPNYKPTSNEFIYVLISVFDNNGSYDQIGFAAWHGSWKIVYSWTTYNTKKGDFEYHPGRITDITLKDNWVYLFEMYTNGNGKVTFQVEGHAAGGSWRWETIFKKTVTTGGSYFVISPWYYNPWSHKTYRDFTDYEEGLADCPYPHVNYDMMYTKVIFYYGQMIYFNDWYVFYDYAPPGVYVYCTTNHVHILNS